MHSATQSPESEANAQGLKIIGFSPCAGWYWIANGGRTALPLAGWATTSNGDVFGMVSRGANDNGVPHLSPPPSGATGGRYVQEQQLPEAARQELKRPSI